MDLHDSYAVLYISSILFSIAVSGGVGIYAARHRQFSAARSFVLVLIHEVIWTAGFLLETLSPGLAGKQFWDTLQWIPTLLLPLAMLNFSLDYTHVVLRRPLHAWLMLSVGLGASLLLVLTNPLHGLAMSEQVLLPLVPFGLYTYRIEPLLWLGVIYSYAIVMASIVILVREALRQRGFYRKQTLIIAAGFMIPTLATLTIALGWVVLPNRDLSPYSFAIANLLIAYGLFRYRIFDLLPFARELVMEHMADGVIVVDHAGRLADLNAAASQMLDLREQAPIGKFLAALAPDWARQLALDPHSQAARRELSLTRDAESRSIDAHISRLGDSRGRFSGHMMILRDITASKKFEAALEQRVHERTADLAKANQRLESEVAQRRMAEQDKETQRAEMEILYRLTVNLSALPPGTNLEEQVAEQLKQLTGAYCVSVAEYRPLQKALELRCLILGSASAQESAAQAGDLTHVSLPVAEETQHQLVSRVVLRYEALSEFMTGAIPALDWDLLQRQHDLQCVYILAILGQGELLGICLLGLQNGAFTPSDWLLHAAANVVAIIYRRQHAELARLESENRFQALADMLPQPIYECDLTGAVTYANRKAYEVFGYETIPPGLSVLDLIAPQHHEQVRQNMPRVLHNREEVHHAYTAVRRDGSSFPVLVYSGPIVRNNRPVGMRGIVADVTELKAAEEELRSSEEKFRSIIEQSSEGIILIGEDGLVLELNKAFEQIYGIPAAEMIGRPFWEITRRLTYPASHAYDPVETAQSNLRQVIEMPDRDRTIDGEVEFFTPAGQRRVIHRTTFPVLVRQGKRMAAVISDITERKDAEREQLRLTRTLTMISECNQALIRQDAENDLLQAICKIIVEMGAYRFAWIGSLRQDGAHPQIVPWVSYGECGDYLERVTACDQDLPGGCLRQYILEGLRNGQPTIISDTRSDPLFEPYRSETLRRGFLSLLVFPLSSGSEIFGSLNIYAGEPFEPDSGELALLTEMANDVSFGILARRAQVERDRAETRMHEANRELHHAYEATLQSWSRALELRERETAGHTASAWSP